ncbi:RNA methyltransferase [Oceanobacter mangrovi]|uniref:RNA methyltransferase n=1 Tax=Oceanobacter mangrovi TaxID=2862510 RepID=UPI001FE5F8EF|nr:RNA methyltransferase [Oceanobacter mangrovi]
MQQSGSAAIALTNPKSATNVGAILRACACFGHAQVYYTGKRFEYADRYHTDTHNAREKVALTPTPSLLEVARPEQKLVCIEFVVGATPLPEFQHPEHALYIFGPEDGSVDQAVVDACDDVVFVPTDGSLNLAATVNVVLYDRAAKQQLAMDPVELVKSSRDVNNRLKIRKTPA